MTTTPTDLASIRDEVGTAPDDDTLEQWFDELGYWLPVAIRVLKRRYADASAGGLEVSQFALDGVLTLGFSEASLASLAAEIARLEDLLNPTGMSGRLQVAPIPARGPLRVLNPAASKISTPSHAPASPRSGRGTCACIASPSSRRRCIRSGTGRHGADTPCGVLVRVPIHVALAAAECGDPSWLEAEGLVPDAAAAPGSRRCPRPSRARALERGDDDLVDGARPRSVSTGTSW